MAFAMVAAFRSAPFRVLLLIGGRRTRGTGWPGPDS